ncbi:hypothetical protein KC352_g6 [Hortaea werneckii]|nr:hypothetical protein KC352_g6 [Hortaea werneckii]
MRLLAILPLALSAAALILSFLCLFAGSKKGFMEDYAVVTLNASQIGQSLFEDGDSSSSSDSDNPLSSFIDDVTSSIEDEIEDTLTSFAKDLGLHDFYSAHLLDFCEVPRSAKMSPAAPTGRRCIRSIERDFCTLLHRHRPDRDRVSDSTGCDIPRRKAVVFRQCDDGLACILVKASEVINKYGNDIGVSANKGSKFLVLTWVATGVMLVGDAIVVRVGAMRGTS